MRRLALPLLALVVLTTGCAESGQTNESNTSGVAGTVFLGPQCPVEMANSPCPDEPTQAEVVVSTVDGSEEIARDRTDAEGNFRIGLEPGEYQLQPFPLEEGGIVFGKPHTVSVPEGEYVVINLALDTGIR